MQSHPLTLVNFSSIINFKMPLSDTTLHCTYRFVARLASRTNYTDHPKCIQHEFELEPDLSLSRSESCSIIDSISVNSTSYLRLTIHANKNKFTRDHLATINQCFWEHIIEKFILIIINNSPYPTGNYESEFDFYMWRS